MAQKFHISPETGRPNICRAQHACPIAGDEGHFATKEEARNAFEASMAKETFTVAHKSSFGAREEVRGKTVWAYDDIMASAGGPKALREANPGLEFRKAADGSLVVGGPAKKVEAYIQEPGGEAEDIKASLANLKAVKPKAAPEVKAAATLSAEGLLAAANEAKALEEDSWHEGDYEFDPASDPYYGEPSAEELEEVSIDNDFSDIKCDDCGRPLDKCACDECEFCGAYEGDEHYDDCPRYQAPRKAYSWD